MEGEATMAGAGMFWLDKHRSLRMKKVENGYEVQAEFIVEQSGADGVPYRCSETRSYVFYTTEEALGFVKNYFEADQSEIRD